VWYAISLGAGLLLGVALLIWALSERSKRAAAEKTTLEAQADADAARKLACENVRVATDLKEQLAAAGRQTAVLRATLEEAQKRLVACEDPQAIKDWLAAELAGGTV
jgi:uncharacterized protein HemX